MAVVLLSFSINSCTPTYRTITLHVDTDSINQENINSTANFGQKGLSNKEFTTFVELGNKIEWKELSST